ncbi:MAG: hydroxyacid dehydrogenase [Bdellovibrionales bacterium]|nr:hydroxyacid dehydrogenase [Bdellovibrionales bacterium]
MAKTKILITDGMAKDGVDILKANPNFEIDLRKATPADELAGIIGGYDCIIIRSATTLTKDLVEKASSMKLIVRAGAGVDNIDVPTATAKKIPVMNTATANSLAAAEQTIALMYSMLRMIPQAAQTMREGKWDRDSFKGYEATGKTLGVIGLGNIGRIVAEKAIGVGMKVVGYDPMVKSMAQVQGKLSKMDESFKLVTTVDEVIAEANIVTLHVPKTKDTANLINADRLAKMKDKSFVINCSRGGIVDEKAVIAAIDSGKLAGAAFDVFEKEPPVFPNPLFNHPKIVCAPHLGASTFEAQDRVALTAANQIVGFFGKGDRTGVIN